MLKANDIVCAEVHEEQQNMLLYDLIQYCFPYSVNNVNDGCYCNSENGFNVMGVEYSADINYFLGIN